jgi:hypothetical protein
VAFNVDTVAERRFQLRTGDSTIEVVASLGRPKEVSRDEWTCGQSRASSASGSGLARSFATAELFARRVV